MSDLLLAEQLFLLGHDDESGKATPGSVSPEAGYAGAVLLDMADQNLVRMDGPRLGPINGHASHPLLTQARLIITSADRFRTVDHWVHWIPADMRKDDEGPIADRIARSLCQRGVLSEQRGQVDPAPERELRAALRSALVSGAEPAARLALLVTLLNATGSVGSLYEDRDERAQAQARAGEIATATKQAVSDATAGAVAGAAAGAVAGAASQSVAAVQAAVFAALTPVFTTPSI